MKPSSITLLAAACLAWGSGCTTTSPQSRSPRVRAYQVIAVADDFVVEVYLNGSRVPPEKRKSLLDRFGATVEETAIEVRQGDWIVFHVVNNRLRWEGAYYFAAAGLIAKGEFGFVSELSSGDWSVCDQPSLAEKFIAQKDFLSDHRAAPVDRPWHEGTGLMKRYAGASWHGDPIWGRERSTWIKIVVP
jgi:hypothetical protein